jgi:pimeloyl-ACP methyl ester carboxylesterase
MNLFQGTMKPFPTLGDWSRQLLLPIAALNLFFFDTGEGGQATPILLIHGLGDEADTWRHVIPAIAATHRVIAPDLPGFGRSDKPKRRYSIPFLRDTLVELLDRLAIPRVILVGHSAGAGIAQAIALANPTRVERLILISGSLVAKENPANLSLLLFLLPGVGEWLYTRLRNDPQMAYKTLEAYYYNLPALPQVDRDFLYQRVNERVWSDGQRQGFLATLRGLVSWLPAQQKRLPAQLQGWNTPTTVIWGENDQVNPVANARALVALLPSARLVLVPAAGHNLQQEKAGLVVQEILNP